MPALAHALERVRFVSQRQAEQIAHFVTSHASDCRRLVVHCRDGVSRSAAVAKAVAEHYGLNFPADYVEHNRHIHVLVSRALAKLRSVR